MPVSSQMTVWYSKIAWRTPWLISGLVRRVRRQELAAREHGVDDRRDVVVVDAGAEKRELLARVDVARRQSAEVIEAPGSESAGSRSSSRSKRTLSGMSWKSSSTDETPTASSIASRSASVSERNGRGMPRPYISWRSFLYAWTSSRSSTSPGSESRTLTKPPLTVRVGVNRFGRLDHRLVDLDDLPRERRDQVRDRLDGLDLAVALVARERLPTSGGS